MCHPCRLVLQDRHGGVFLYSLNSGELMQPPGFEGKLVAAVWHADDPNLLVLASDEGMETCQYSMCTFFCWMRCLMTRCMSTQRRRQAVDCSAAGTLFSYVYIPSSVAGQGLKLLGRQAKPHGALPLVLHKGRLTCRLPAGSHEDVQLAAFTALEQVHCHWGTRLRVLCVRLSFLHLGGSVRCGALFRSAGVPMQGA